MAAIIKPFQYEVWILIVVAFLAVTVCLFGLNISLSTKSATTSHIKSFQRSIDYIFGVLCSQGDY